MSTAVSASADIAIFSSEFVSVARRGRHLLAILRAPAHVLSTCACNGGQRSDLRFLVNHQSCEGAKHQERADFILGLGQSEYQRHVCGELRIDAAATAVMGTAANMQYLGVVTRTWSDLAVTAIVTAGVGGNAGCAGDPANYDEVNGQWIRTTPLAAGAGEGAAHPRERAREGESTKLAGTAHGTINTLLFFSSPLSPAALARAVVTMTEAKSSALAELAIGSRYSTRLATGTGTDQYALAAPQSGATLRTWTGHHTKSGELIGDAVRAATLEALRWQNGLEASYTRSILHALGRFGVKEPALRAALESRLSAKETELLAANWQAVIHEPQVSAAAYALAAVLDRVQFGTIGASVAHEAVLNQAALLAAGLAASVDSFAEMRGALANDLIFSRNSEGAALAEKTPEIVAAAVALGWRMKWRRS